MSAQDYAQMQHMGLAQYASGSQNQPPQHSYAHHNNPHVGANTNVHGNTSGNGNLEQDQMDSPEELDHDHDHEHDHGVWERSDTKRSKREPGGSSGKKIRSCIYCRRSHMVCDAERPCRRCVKRGITHLCLEDSKLAARQLVAQAQRAAQKRANSSSGTCAPGPSGSGTGSGSGSGGSTREVTTAEGEGRRPGYKKRRTSSNGPGFQGMTQMERKGDEREDVGELGGGEGGWGNGQGFGNFTGAGVDQGSQQHQQQQQQPSSNWSFLPPSNDGNDVGIRDPNPNLLSGPGLGELPSIWPASDSMDMRFDASGSGSNPQFGVGAMYAPGPSSSSPSNNNHNNNNNDNQRAEEQNLAGRQIQEQDPNKYLNVALNNAPRRASAERGGEFGILSEYLESLGIPSLPGGLGDVFTETAQGQGQMMNPQGLAGPSRLGGDQMGNNNNNNDQGQGGTGLVGLDNLEDFGFDWSALGSPLMGLFNVETNAKRVDPTAAEDNKPLIPEASNTEKFYLAAADQQSGTRDERLKKVIQAKYEAGLLKPYDYARGYARMYKWLEKNVSQASIQAILRPMSVFRPAFRAIAQSLSDLDLIFVEEAFERLMLDYDRVFSAIHTPACLWRRTGEIYKGNKEMSNLTGIPSQCFRGGNLGIFQLMDEESVVKYYQLFGSIAFDTNTKSVNTVCTLHIPSHLTRIPQGDNTLTHTTATTSPVLGPAPTHPFNNSTFNSPMSTPPNALGGNPSRLRAQNSSIPSLSLGQSMTGIEQAQEAKVIKCALNFTIRRDSWGMPIAIIGNWIPF